MHLLHKMYLVFCILNYVLHYHSHSQTCKIRVLLDLSLYDRKKEDLLKVYMFLIDYILFCACLEHSVSAV